MERSSSVGFWPRFKIFLTYVFSDGVHSQSILDLIRNVGEGNSLEALSREMRYTCNQLPQLDLFPEEWQKMLAYLEYHKKAITDPNHVVNQLHLVSRGLRGPMLDSTCSMLPL